MRILALDLGKFKTVACLYQQSPDQPHHWDFVNVDTPKKDFARLIQQFQADVLVFETCTAAGAVMGDDRPDALFRFGRRVLPAARRLGRVSRHRA